MKKITNEEELDDAVAAIGTYLLQINRNMDCYGEYNKTIEEGKVRRIEVKVTRVKNES